MKHLLIYFKKNLKVLLTATLFLIIILIAIADLYHPITYMGNALPGKVGRVEGTSKIAEEGKDEAGFLTYGPYVILSSGNYKVNIKYSATSNASGGWDFAFSGAPSLIKYGKLPFSSGGEVFSEKLTILKEDAGKPLEIRISYTAKGTLKVAEIVIVNIVSISTILLRSLIGVFVATLIYLFVTLIVPLVANLIFPLVKSIVPFVANLISLLVNLLLDYNKESIEIIIIPGFAIIIVLVGYLASVSLQLHSHWISFLLLGFTAPLFGILYSRFINSKVSENPYSVPIKILTGFAFSLSIIFLIYKSVDKLCQFSQQLLILIIGAIIITVYATVKLGYPDNNLEYGNKKRWFFMITSFLFSMAIWCGLYELPNWNQFGKSLTERPITTIVIYFIFLSIVLRRLFNMTPTQLQKVFSHISSKSRKMMPLFFIAVTFVIFLLMSFRFDTLFLGTSEGHWEYYVGPIRNIKNGSWLLWDTPSQYGFLNILAAASVPVASSWQSLYVLQGILLFIAAILIFMVFLSKDRTNILFAFVITFSSLFFADPDLIGPYLYPSSSVMRFFWCYVLLGFFYLTHHNERVALKTIVLWGTLLWIIGFFWSSESAIYSTVTFYCGLVSAVSQNAFLISGNDKKLKIVVKQLASPLAIPIAVLFAFIGLVAFYYRVVLGHFPDLFIFVEHGVGYAGGFGSMTLNPFGSIWILFLLFCAMLVIIVRLIMRDPLNRHVVPLVASAGCLWAVSSYFIGRAVPNNITAILPVLCMLIAIVFSSINGLEFDISHSIFKAISVPLLMLVLMTSFGNYNFLDKLRTFQTLSANISQKVRVADPLLQELIAQAGIKPGDPVVFYGYAAAMPRWKCNNDMVLSEKTWLPNPLQLLEEPIKDERRTVYLNRFMDRSYQSGFFIHAKGEAEDRLAKWQALIARTHSPVRIYENSKWKITYFDQLKSYPSISTSSRLLLWQVDGGCHKEDRNIILLNESRGMSIWRRS